VESSVSTLASNQEVLVIGQANFEQMIFDLNVIEDESDIVDEFEEVVGKQSRDEEHTGEAQQAFNEFLVATRNYEREKLLESFRLFTQAMKRSLLHSLRSNNLNWQCLRRPWISSIWKIFSEHR
jgi:hypothetical protein